MMQEKDELTIRRILVALDTSKHSLAALAAAVELAVRLQAELTGLFVEDINILRLAGLPFAREMRYPSTVSEELDGARLEQELRGQATQARRALAHAAEAAQIPWSFRVVRGQVTAEIMAAALEADLLSLGIASRPLIHRTRLGSTARAVTAAVPLTVLLLQSGETIGQPVLVVYDQTTTAKRALAIAVRLAQTTKQTEPLPLTVIFVEGEETMTAAAKEVDTWLQRQGWQATYRWLPRVDVSTLAQAVRTQAGGLLVLGGESPLSRPETLQSLLDQIECPLLLVR